LLDFSNFNCTCDTKIMLQLYVYTVMGSAFQTSMDWKDFKRLGSTCRARRKQLKSLALCSAKHLLVLHCVVSRDVLECSGSFFLVLYGGFLMIHFNLIIIRDELLLCSGGRLGGDTIQPVCFASTSFKFFKLSEPWISMSDSVL